MLLLAVLRVRNLRIYMFGQKDDLTFINSAEGISRPRVDVLFPDNYKLDGSIKTDELKRLVGGDLHGKITIRMYIADTIVCGDRRAQQILKELPCIQEYNVGCEQLSYCYQSSLYCELVQHKEHAKENKVRGTSEHYRDLAYLRHGKEISPPPEKD